VPIKQVVARFYLTTGGANPVRDWLMRLPGPDRKKVGHTSEMLNLAGQSACPYVNRSATGFGRYAAIYPVDGSPVCCFV